MEKPVPETKELQYQRTVELKLKGLTPFGMMANQAWHDDPKHVLFTLSRYKFVAKMLSGLDRVLEVGCADAFGTRLVVQEVKQVVAVDFDPVFIQDVQTRMEERWGFEARTHDILSGPMEGRFDGAYALDVIEHIPEAQENIFLQNISASLSDHGVLIIGTPSIQSQVYASPPSKAGHVNCKDGPGLKRVLQQFYHNVFVFSMNDEVVHTGYFPMAHYLLAVACSRKTQ